MKTGFFQRKPSLTIFMFFCLFLNLSSSLGQAIKIMPLGNSITYDYIVDDTRPVGEKIGYRYKLYQLLSGQGYSFNFVGSENSGENYLPAGYTENAGFPGKTVAQLLSILQTGYLNTYQPDIILLEIGTNGLNSSTDADNSIIDLAGILNVIDNFETSIGKEVPVFLAKIINRAGTNPTGNHVTTTYYNTKIEQLVQNRPSDLIYLLDMEVGAGIDYRYTTDGGDMIDEFHPAQSGYQKMAQVWYSRVEPYLALLENSAPELSGIEGSVLAYDEGAGSVSISSSISISDPDLANLEGATISISNGYISSEDVLSFSNANGIAGSWNGSGTLSLSGSSSITNYISALRSVQYENTNTSNPSTAERTVTFLVNDGSANSNPVSRNISIININAAPVLSTMEGSALNYNEGAGKVSVTASVLLTDADNTNMQSATVSISSGFVASEDVLSFVNANGITGSWDGAGTLSLSGSSSVANYRAALRSVQYENTNTSNPSTAERTVTFLANDGTANSNPVSRNISIINNNAAPVLSALEESALSYNEGTGKVPLTSSLSISDDDNTTIQSATVRISSGFVSSEDVLSFTSANGITASWDGSQGILPLSGSATVANYQLALKNIQYENTNTTNPSNTTRTISFVVNDGTSNSNTVTRNITVNSVNSAPVLSSIGASALSYTEGSGKINVTTTLSVTDSDNTTIQSAEVRLSQGFESSEDILTCSNSNGIAVSWNSSLGILSFSGASTITNYRDALRNVQYENINATNPIAASRAVSFAVNDGGSNSNTLSRNINIVQINSAPVVNSIEGTPLSYNEGAGKVSITNSIAISDLDNVNLQSATIQITSGYSSSQDVLSFTTANGIVAAWNSANGTLSLSGNSTLLSYQSALKNVMYENTNISNPSTAQRTISFRVSDGTENSNLVSRNININHTNNAPVLSNIESSALSYSDGSGKVSVTNSISLDDSDNTTIQSATVWFTSGYKNTEDNLSFVTSNGITASWNGSTGALSLSGSSSETNYRNALRNVKYENSNGINPSTEMRTISFRVSDGTDNSNTVFRNIAILHTNHIPSLSGIEGSTLSYNEGSGAVSITNTVQANDPDNTTLQSATIRISGGFQSSEDMLSYGSGNGINAVWDGSQGILALSGEALVTVYQTALRNVKYENTNNINPSVTTRNISYTISDGTDNSNTVNRNISIIHTNKAPSLNSIESTPLFYNEGSGTVSITSTINVSDADHAILQSAIVRINSGYLNSEDLLTFTSASGISASWNDAQGVLTLSGSSSVANYQTALRNIKYENTNTTNPSTTARNITFVVSDGTSSSNILARNITINHTNRVPVLSNLETGVLQYNEGSGKISVTSSVSVNDADHVNLQSAIIRFTSGYRSTEDILSFTSAHGISASWDNVNGVLTLTGASTIAHYQTALRNVFYENINSTNPSVSTRTISFAVYDGTEFSNTQSRNVSINHTNRAPVLSNMEGTSLSYLEGSSKVVVTSTLSITDQDNVNLQSATVKFNTGFVASEDGLFFTPANGITSTWDGSLGILSLTGTASLADYRQALRNIRYENSNNTNPSVITRTISFVVFDGIDYSNSLTRNISVIHINRAPLLDNIESSSLIYNEGSGKISITSSILVSDVDNANINGASVEFTSGFKSSEDGLSLISSNGITGIWDGSAGVLSISGNATIPQYQTALRNVKYENSNATNPNTETRVISFNVNDGILTSNSISRNITINHTSRAPELKNIETSTLPYNTSSGKIIITALINASDLDDNTLESAIVKITSGYIPSEDVLSFEPSDGITATWDVNTGTLQLNGIASLANYQKALRNIRYENKNTTNPNLTNRSIGFTVNDGNLSSIRVERLLAVNAPPTVINVKIEGTPTVCKILTGSYTYSDKENDTENITSFRWLRASDINGTKTPILGATSKIYTLTDSDLGKRIFFEVTPSSKTGSKLGLPVISDPTPAIMDLFPGVTITGTTSICEGTSTYLSLNFTGTPPFNFTYTDGSTNFNLLSPNFNAAIKVSKGGVYKGVSLMDQLGCAVSNLPSAATITVKPKPTVDIIGLNSAYSLRGSPVSLKGAPTGGIFSGNGVDPSTNTFYPSLAGVLNSPHAIVYFYLDPQTTCGNSDTVKVEIVDANASIAGFRAQGKYCNFDSPFKITGTNIANAIGSFSISGGIGLTDNKNNSAVIDPGKLESGNYTISYTYFDEVYQTIYKNFAIEHLDEAIIYGFAESRYCKNTPSFKIHGNYASGIFEGSGIVYSGNEYYFNPENAPSGINKIKYTYSTSYGCKVYDTLLIKLNPVTPTKFSIENNCLKNDSTIFKNKTIRADSITSWHWNFGDENASETENNSVLFEPMHKYSKPGDYTIELITENLANCIDTLKTTIHLGDIPRANFQWDKECVDSSETVHITNLSSGIDALQSYAWIVTDSSHRETLMNSKNIVHSFTSNQKYQIQLKVTSMHGCTDSIAKNYYLSKTHILKDSLYLNDFEKHEKAWHIEQPYKNNWIWSTPEGSEIAGAHSGKKANFTQFPEKRKSQQLIITSPCFDFTGIKRPFIEMWINGNNSINREGAVLQYNINSSGKWETAGKVGSGTNWYNGSEIVSNPGWQPTGWTGNTNGWIKTRNNLDSLTEKKNVKFRIVYGSDSLAENHNGFSFDDVLIGERNRNTLMEHFTNLSSNAGLESNEDLNKLLKQTSNSVIGMQYHASFPGSDSLNANNPSDPGARILYYGIGNIPISILNGGTSTNLVFNYVNKKPTLQDLINQSLEDAKYDIALKTEKTANNLTSKVTIAALSNLVNQNNTLYVAVVEDIQIQVEDSIRILNNVLKKLVPTAAGTSLPNTWYKDQQYELNFNWQFHKVYDPNNIKLIAFIQSENTKEILQVTASAPSFGPSVKLSEILNPGYHASIFPNPASEIARIAFSSPLNKKLKMELINRQGQTICIKNIQKDIMLFEFSVDNLPNGIYLVRLLDTSGNYQTLKLLISK